VRSVRRSAVFTLALAAGATGCQVPARSAESDVSGVQRQLDALPDTAFVAPAGSPWHVAADAPAGFLRADSARRTAALLAELVALDSSNPPGNERLVADALAARLAGLPGVQTEVLVVPGDPARANFVARLSAVTPTRRPVLVLGHMDVVGAAREAWSSDPFVPTLIDGRLQGRGVIDDKGMLAAAAVALEVLASQRHLLDRDIILLATAAEEGGDPVGVDLLLERHRDRLGDAEFALNEGGRIRVEQGRVHSVNLQTTEKIYYDVEVTATGPGGHGSVPLPDNALAALARAVAAVHAWRAPVRLNDTTRRYFGGLAALQSDPALAAAMAAVAGPDDAAALAAAEVLAQADPLFNAVLRSGAALTQVSGGFRNNVIPSAGRANFNLRAVPGDDVNELLAAMAAAAGEPSVKFTLVGEPRTSPPVSPAEGPFWDAFVAAVAALAPDAVVLPFMSTGGTDGAALRAAGLPTWGILPFPLEAEDERRMHGDDERVPLVALGWGTELIYRTLHEVARKP